MKKLLLLLLFTGVFAGMNAQQKRDQYKKGRWGIEMNFLGAPVVYGITSVTGVYNYNLAPCFSVGGGVGVFGLSRFDHFLEMTTVYAVVRLKLEVPSWKVSPFFFFDAGVNLYEDTAGAITYTVVGARFRLRNNGNILLGVKGCPLFTLGACNAPFDILPMLHIGYTF